tara:strand:- start:262 stop:801 length:540 start_codon:yes stop_codon:yes gene_type:complete
MNYLIKYLHLNLLFVCLISYAYPQQNMVGEKAYIFTSKTLDDERRFSLSTIIKNDKPIFINFFATWCSPCIEELPLLYDFHLENKDYVEMIIIDVNNLSVLKNNVPIKLEEDQGIAKKILLDNKISFTSLFDKHAFIAKQYGVSNLPHSVLIKDGIIVWEGRKKLTKITLNNLKKYLND